MVVSLIGGDFMTRTISKLWRGAFEITGHSGVNKKELDELIELLEKQHNKLTINADENFKNEIEKFDLTHDEYTVLLCEQAFCDGFCLASKILTEALNGAEYLI